MDHRALAHYGGDVTHADVQPLKRRAVLARYGADNQSEGAAGPAEAAA
ncbi:hypothetical protein [Streptomyces brasiliensis]|uniref:Uncharacterized protein n=1 Tax=Streptomyces brasiliensis TaxID=1954 RepID=A0A917NTG9_9ACTN|nr:hypothetical protein [Streptomyces brasiliensis]GGJ26965.1 hypothetical protein GCM10010121_042710 [Streptomyces brasiliensis]